jgi:integrase
MAIRLSAAAIDRLKPDACKRLEIADAGKPGLYLVIQPSGHKSWAVRYRVRGRSRKLTLEGFPSLVTARKLAQDALDTLSEGEDPALAKMTARHTPSTRIDDVFADFMAKHVKKRDGRPIRESTQLETARLLGLKLDATGTWVPRAPKTGVLAHWSGREIHEITKRDVLDVLDARVAAGTTVGANRTLSALKSVFSWCVKRDISSLSPCDRVDDPSPEVSVQRPLTDTELRALWQAADKLGFPYGRMVQFLLLTGQRRDEARKAVRSEFDLTKQIWKLAPARTKNGHEHHVPLSNLAMRLLQDLPKIKSDQGWLFTINGEVPVSNLARRKRRLDLAMAKELRADDPRSEVIPWRLHDLRHTLKTWMQQARIPKDVRNAVQNHFDGDMDELYGHYSFENEKRDALEAWARHLENLIADKSNQILLLRRA